MQSLLENYTEVLAIIVVVVGIVLARWVRKGVGLLLSGIDERISRYGVGGSSAVSPRLIRIAKNLVFWIVVLGTVVLALLMLDIRQLPLALDGLFEFLGRLLLGLAIVGAGHLLGLLARRAVGAIIESRSSSDIVGRLAYWAIVLVATVMGLAQLNIDTSFVTQLALVLIAVVLGGLTLAFALGARTQAANLLAQRDLRRYSVGERIRIGEHEGTIVEIYATGVDLETAQGIVSIPAAQFAEASVLRSGSVSTDD